MRQCGSPSVDTEQAVAAARDHQYFYLNHTAAPGFPAAPSTVGEQAAHSIRPDFLRRPPLGRAVRLRLIHQER